MKKVIFTFILMQVMLFANVDTIYKVCANCHGQNGETSAMNGKSKIINEMSKEDFIVSMNGYKDGSYGGALKGLMKSQVKKLTKENIEDLANKITK